MRLLSVLLPVCLVASGCTSEKEAPDSLVPGAAESAAAAGHVVAPDAAPSVVEQAGLLRGKAINDGEYVQYNGTVTLSGDFTLIALDGLWDTERVCFIPDVASAKALAGAGSERFFCFQDMEKARELLKIKPIQWNRYPPNVCEAKGAATVTVTGYEDFVVEGDSFDTARLVKVLSASEAKPVVCDSERWVEEGTEAGGEEAQAELKDSQAAEASQGGSWPSDLGTYRTSSSAGIPAFPKRLEGFRPRGDAQSGIIRVFEGKGWTGIHEFEVGANGCSHSMMMVRWRSANAITIQTSTAGSHIDESAPDAPASTHGYMFGSRCDQPAFKFGKTEGTSTLVDVFYEVQHWDAAP